MQLERFKREMREKQEAERIRRENELQAKIRNSLTEAKLKISNLGSYKADPETFPITIKGKTEDIKIPRSEARSLKENYRSTIVTGIKQFQRNLKDYEYFNLVIIHPVTGSRYSFGEQRDVTGGLVSAPGAVAGAKVVTPPSLALKVRLSEPNGNGFLDAEEKGKIIVEITNSGKGPAYGVIIDIKLETEDPVVTYSQTRIIGELSASLTRSVDFSIEAAKTVKRASRSFTVTATETNGFVPTPVLLTFETFPLLLPKLELVDYASPQLPGITS